MATVRISAPIDEATIRSLNAGDEVLISGRMFTGRDAVHKYLYSGGAVPEGLDLTGGIIYHCGPVVTEKTINGKRMFEIHGAGPTTSSREEPYQATIIERFGIRAVIGKGGMGAKTLEACQKFGAVYLHAVGGAAQVYAENITSVDGVFLEEFGSPEAVWVLTVKDFSCTVTMDSHGNSLHTVIQDASLANLQGLL